MQTNMVKRKSNRWKKQRKSEYIGKKNRKQTKDIKSDKKKCSHLKY